MKILFTGSFPPHPGGSGVVNGQLLEGLLRNGFHLQIVTPATPKDLGRSRIMRKRFSGAELFEFPWGQPQIEPWSDGFENEKAKRHIANTLQLCEACIKDDPPDLLLIGREASIWGAPELAARYRLPTAVFCHGIGHITGGSLPTKTVRRVLDELQKVDLAIAPAKHMAEALIERGLKNVHAIPNSVDTDLYRPGPMDTALRRNFGIRDDQIVIVHASNMKSLKRGHDIVASAVSCLRADPNLLYLIIGDGPCLKDLQDAARREGLEDRFRFVGWVDRDEMPGLLRLADIVVMPSAFEGLAMAYLEAMATGLALIASDIDAANEVITDNETGFTFPVGDVEALSRVTLRVAADASLRKRVGQRARAHIETHHRLEVSVRRLNEAFIDLTGAGARKLEADLPITTIQP